MKSDKTSIDADFHGIDFVTNNWKYAKHNLMIGMRPYTLVKS